MPAYRCAVHRQTDFCRSFILRRHAATQVGTGTAVYALLLWYLIPGTAVVPGVYIPSAMQRVGRCGEQALRRRSDREAE